jgi:hypothetical protein
MVSQMFLSQAIGNTTTNFLGIIIKVSFNETPFFHESGSNDMRRALATLH